MTAADEPAPDARKEIGERYAIVRRLGSGGMGEVYLARDATLEREVAIKLHRPGRQAERLRREAIAMARLSHPNVVTVYEVGEVDGRAYVAMEYVPGTTLRGYLAEKRRSERELLAMLRQIGEGLAAAHKAGLIHRDFKPENVLIGEDGRPRVTDFGLARDTRSSGRRVRVQAGTAIARTVPAEAGKEGAELRTVELDETAPAPAAALGATLPAELADGSGGDRGVALAATLDERMGSPPPGSARAPTPPVARAGTAALTVDGAVLGTPAYMAPEQAAGGVVDARADQYAFCVVAWEALCGARPQTGRSAPGAASGRKAAASATAPVTTTPGAPAPASRRLRAALERGLSPDPRRRYPDMAALLAELRPPRPWAAIGGALVIAAAAGGVALWQLSGEPALSCDRAGDDIAALETPLVSQLHAGDAAGRAAAVRLSAHVDELIAGTRASAAASCRARQSGGWSAELYLRARGCLAMQQSIAQGQLRSLALPALGAVSASATDHSTVDPATALGYALPLPSPAQCGDPAALAGWPAPPADEAKEAGSVRGALVLAERALERHDLVAAGALIDAAARSPLSGAPYVASRLAMARGLLAATRGELADGQALIDAAVVQAKAAGDVETQLLAAAAAITCAGELRRDRSAAEARISAALAEAEGLASRAPGAAVRLYLAAARVVRDEPSGGEAGFDEEATGGDADDAGASGGAVRATTRASDRALVLLTKALALLDEQRPSPSLWAALQLRAEAQLSAGRYGDAEADHLRALALGRALLGPDHPEVALIAATCAGDLAQLPSAARQRKACADDAERILAIRPARPSTASARAHFLLGQMHQQSQRARARDELRAARDELLALEVRDLELAAVEDALALAHLDLGQPAEAVALLADALALREARIGPEHLELGGTLYNLAVAERERKNLSTAQRHARRAIALFERHRDGDRFRYAVAISAQISNLEGDAAAAIATTARVERWTSAGDPLSLAWPRLERARALIAQGGAGREAAGLLLGAKQIYVVLGQPQRVLEIDQLLAQLAARKRSSSNR